MILSTGTAESLQMRKLKKETFFFRMTLTFNFVHLCIYQMLQSATLPFCIKNPHAIKQLRNECTVWRLKWRLLSSADWWLWVTTPADPRDQFLQQEGSIVCACILSITAYVSTASLSSPSPYILAVCNLNNSVVSVYTFTQWQREALGEQSVLPNNTAQWHWINHFVIVFSIPVYTIGLTCYSSFSQMTLTSCLIPTHDPQYFQATTLVTRVGKKTFYTHFAPPHPCAILTKHFHLTQVCILSFSHIEKGNGGVDAYSVGITILISCFWHFPTQFVQGCTCSSSPIPRNYSKY